MPLQIAFLDMRGCLGQTMTTAGDVVYDLAKVYQSLGGYDYILLDQPILNSDQELLNDLQECFAEVSPTPRLVSSTLSRMQMHVPIWHCSKVCNYMLKGKNPATRTHIY